MGTRFPTYAVLLILLTLLAFWLRLYQLDHQSLRGDEAATVLYSALPVNELWELSRLTDPHPPLYYALLHPWQWLVGEEVWVMRFAGAAASTLAIPALYALARRTLRDRPISLLAAAVLALNPLQIWLAQDIRSYPFFTTLGLLSSAALWQALSQVEQSTSFRPWPGRYPRSWPWLLYLTVTVSCFYIHYYTVFLIAFQGLFVLLHWRRFWPSRWPWLMSQIGLGLLLLPGLQLAYRFAGGEAAGGIATIPTLDIFRLAFTALLTGFTLNPAWGGWLALGLTPIWVLGLLALLKRDWMSGAFWGLFFMVPVLGVIGLSIDRPFFKERFLVQAQPALALLLAAGFLTLLKPKLSPTPNKPYSPLRVLTPRFASLLPASRPYFLLPTSLLCLISLLFTNLYALTNYFTDPTYAKAPPWRLYHDYVSEHARPGDVMLTNFPEAAVSYYSPNQLPFYVVPAERDRSVEFRVEQTAQIAAAYQRLWFLPLLRQGFDEPGDVLNWLDRHADRVHQIFFRDYHLNLYLSPPTIEAALLSQPVDFAHGLSLRGYQIFDKTGESRLSAMPATNDYLLTLKPGEQFTLSLYWLAHAPTGQPYTVFVHVLAADGFNRTGQDNQPVWGSYPTTQWQPGEKVTDQYTLTIPAGAPPGDHRLELGWYDPATQQRVEVLAGTGQPSADHYLLNLIIRVESAGNE
jgi:hypothetical protein